MTVKLPSTEDRELRHMIHEAAHLLPAQGPIGVFIHHNTLHAFQHLPFEEAVAKAGALFGTEPYLREEQYRREIERGRILLEDIEFVLAREENAPVLSVIDRRFLRRLMLWPGIRALHRDTIQWEISEGGFLDNAASRQLFDACLRRTPAPAPTAQRAWSRVRDPLLVLSGADLDEVVHPLLITLCGAFLDQGLAYWPMPDRENGFYKVVRNLWMKPGAVAPAHLESLAGEFRRQAAGNMTAEDVVHGALDAMGVPPRNRSSVISAELLALPGWAGLFNTLEYEPELAPHESVPCSLIEYLAVRFTLTVAAASSIAGGKEYLPALWQQAQSPARSSEPGRLLTAARLYETARLLRMPASKIESVDAQSFDRLLHEVEAFDDIERRRILHLAYERRHERLILGPLGRHRLKEPPKAWTQPPEAQVFFCLDEREESIRRHLEEIEPAFETLGAAGFYGFAVDYAGIDDAHGVSLCPVVVKPKHAVREIPFADQEHLHRRRRAFRAWWAKAARYLFVSSRTLFRGGVSTAVLGIFSLVPLIAHILSPGRYARLSRALNRWILPEPRTELTLMRTDPGGHEIAEHLLLGFSIDEKIERVASVLAPAGLLDRFAPVVVVLGHGSTSLNNPHESAHDCGACGGRRGGPNGRLFAAMANHPGVRAGLGKRGIHIPDTTWFVGGYHDTCNDEIEYFDLESLPEDSRPKFERVRASLDRARALDAHERCRRFEAASTDLSPGAALWHVQERSEHLAEPRPEYGHCTNAVCIVGRRETTRGLFFDRRAFLVSYDPALDPEDDYLARLLGAAIPVCAGISLEYYFSSIDNEGYGCGTKLPHNVTGLVGVMNGPSSDLRTGLPWQMVEIHEPVRCLFSIETTPERLMKVINSSELLAEFVHNRWIRLSTIHPETGAIHVWRDGAFEPSAPADYELPAARTSAGWYRGKMEHLPVARITG
jgi:uncharacterized protein